MVVLVGMEGVFPGTGDHLRVVCGLGDIQVSLCLFDIRIGQLLQGRFILKL